MYLFFTMIEEASESELLADSYEYIESQQDRQRQITLWRRTLAAFWLLGVVNNSSFVIMIASAKSISDGTNFTLFQCTFKK